MREQNASAARRARPPRGDSVYVPPGFSNLIGYHLRIAQEASFQAVQHEAGKKDLKPGWYTILTILSANPGLTPTELSKLSGRDRSTLTSTLNGLDTRGLIARRRNSKDQRSYGVKLTALGEAVLRKLQIVAREHDARLDAIVGKDKPLLLSLLLRIVAALNNKETAENHTSVAGTKLSVATKETKEDRQERHRRVSRKREYKPEGKGRAKRL